MFGYIRPYKMELKLKDIHRYNDLYCGLCHALRKDYGQIYGCALSYDLTFLLVVLNGFSEEQEKRVFRCPLNPMKIKRVSVSEQSLRYAAFINYFLIYLKTVDDIEDENQLLKKIIKRALEKNKKYVRQYTTYARIADDLKGKMLSFCELERSEAEFDELTNIFGEFFSAIFKDYFEENGYEINTDLEELCLNLGKWIYVIDAFDDYSKDIKKNEFNLLKTLHFETETPDMEQIHQRVKMILMLLINNMKKRLKKISLKRDYEIVENIIVYGCDKQYYQVLKRRYPEYYNKNFGNAECSCK